MFLDCKFQTNILGSFKSHKCRKHSSFSTKEFKPGVVGSSTLAFPESPSNISADDGDDICENAQQGSNAGSVNNLPDVIERNLAAALLKLEHFSHVPSKAITEFLVELHHLNDSLSRSHANNVLLDIFQKHKLQVDRPVTDEIISSLYSGNQLNKATERGGRLSSVFKRTQYYKTKFGVVEPVEYILDAKKKKTFQYVPIIKKQRETETAEKTLYRSYKDGLHCKENILLSGENLSLSITLYSDDFEVCNPLGTSRKTHKPCSVYWVLSNLPPGSHSILSSIFLTILCKTDDVKSFGDQKVFEPLIHDLRSLEANGIFVPQLNKSLKRYSADY